jgi:hypothetical protein
MKNSTKLKDDRLRQDLEKITRITRKERHVGKIQYKFSNRFLSYKNYFLSVIDVAIVLKIFFRYKIIYKPTIFVT